MSFGFGSGDFIASFQLANRLRLDWVEVPSEYTSIENQVKNIETILRDVGDLGLQIDLTRQEQTKIQQISQRCQTTLEGCNKIIDKYSSLVPEAKDANSIGRKWQRFKHQPEEIRNIESELMSLISQLTSLRQGVEARLIDDANDAMGDLHLSAEQRERKTIAEWYAPSKYADQQASNIRHRQEGTGAWFFNNQHYKNWCQGIDSTSTLLCPGVPGSGKTMMLAGVVEDLQKQFAHYEDVAVAYFYCKYNRRDEQELPQIYASLVRQLFQDLANVPKEIRELYSKHRDGKDRPSLEELRFLTRILIQQHSRVFILIDALDEANTNDGSFDTLLDGLFQIQSEFPENHVNLLFTTRPIPDVIQRFAGDPQIEIKAASVDVKRYIDTRIPELGSSVSAKPDLQTEITSQITSLAGGRFLLAQLHFDALQGQTDATSIRKTLKSLPKGSNALFEAYNIARNRIEAQPQPQRDLARQVLMWITYARRELFIDELQEAIAIQPGMKALKRGNAVNEEEITSVCAGLVVVGRVSRTVRLAHYTTQEYLERVKEDWFPNAQAQITRKCLAYLSMTEFESAKISKGFDYRPYTQQYKLLKFAANYWGFHAAEADDITAEAEVLQFLQNDRKVRFSGQLMLERDNWRKAEVFQTAEAMSLHVCAYFNLPQAAKSLIGSGVDTNSRDSQKATPLIWAARYGHKEVLEVILASADAGAHSEGDKNGQTPLSHAAENGHKEVVRSLLAQSDINVNRTDKSGRTAMMMAAFMGHKEVIELLIARPEIELNRADRFGKTELMTAAIRGNKEVVEMFLARPDIDVNKPDKDGRPALRRVLAYMGHKEVVNTLLTRKDIDVNKEDKAGRTTLMIAASMGDKEVVTSLLARSDVEINKADKFGETALMMAAEEGQKDIVQLFLTRRPDIQVKLADKEGRTALAYATTKGHQGVVDLLRAYSAKGD